MGLKMIFYLTNVTNAVNLPQPSVCIGGGLHAPSFRTALSKPRNLSYFPLKTRSRPKKGENRPRPRTERLGSWVSKIARLGEDTTQKTTTNFCSQRYQPSRVTTLQKHRHPGSKGRVQASQHIRPRAHGTLPGSASSKHLSLKHT